MKGSKTLAVVPYKDEMHEVDGVDYIKWGELIEDGVVGDTETERNILFEWITFDFLIDKGILVSAPKSLDPRKQLKVDPLESAIGSKSESKAKPSIPWHETGWTQEKVLKEAERNLKIREQLFEKRVALAKKQTELGTKRIPQHIGGYDFKIYNADGSELSILDIIKFAAVLVIITWILSAAFC